MADEYLGKQFLQLAIETEKNGRAFYENSARQSKKKDVQDVFRQLAAREKDHENTFRNMLSRLGNLRATPAANEDYQYIRYLADSLIRDSERSQSPKVKPIRTDIEAMEMGIGLEKDCILFYSEARGMLPAADQNIIDMITSEEKKHLSELSVLLGRLRSGLQTVKG